MRFAYDVATGGSRSPSTSPRRRDDRRRRRDDREAPPPANVLGCFNLSLRTTSRDLEDLFGQYGEIKECTVVYDHYTRQSRGFGFITFATVEQAAAARAAVDKMVLHDRPMRVDFSLTLRPHNPTPGQYMGRDFRRRGHGGGGGGSRDSYRDSHRERYPPRDDYPRERDPYRRREPSYSPPRRSRRSPSPRRRRSPSRD
ncbi:transformer 2 beta [Gaertneriomyces sp. JEL0708]|nr:transformer 2 beta [Gaertneriomyces sp. JEL0708]